MSDTTTPKATPSAPKPAPPAEPAAAPPAAPAPAEETVDYKSKYEQAISHSRTWEERAKANKEAADELEKLKKAQQTDEQRQAEHVAKLEAENARYRNAEQQREWSRQVAEDTGVPAEVLRGSTLDEMQKHAEQLKPVYATPKAPAPPVPSVGDQPQTTNVSLPDQIAAAQAAGDNAKLQELKAMQLSTNQ